MSKKKLKEYEEKYGHIPTDFFERFSYLMELKNIKPKDLEHIKNMIKYIKSIPMKEISFVFYFTPDATPRARYSRFTRAFYVKNALDYKTIFREFIDSCEDIDKFITTPCEFYCTTYKPTPKAMNRYEHLLAEMELIPDISKPDWDNLGKTYSDMVQQRLIIDDAVICKGCVEKKYSIRPRIEIRIKYYTKHGSTYNQTKINNILKRQNERSK